MGPLSICGPAAAAFAYSKDWLVTELHRLSSLHQLRAPAVICIPGFLKEIKTPAGGSQEQPGRISQMAKHHHNFSKRLIIHSVVKRFRE